MSKQMILTVAGNDRPGLTQRLADAVMNAGGNWLESRLVRLGGQYLGAVLVDVPEAAVDFLVTAFEAFEKEGFSIAARPVTGDAIDGGQALALELVGQDRPGIVREVTAVLTRLAVNIEELETDLERGAESGARLFRARAELRLPRGLDQRDVTGALEAISSEIMVDLKVSPSD